MQALTPGKESDAAGILDALFRLYLSRGDVLDKTSGYPAALANYRTMGRLAAATGRSASRQRAQVEQGYRLTLLGQHERALAIHQSLTSQIGPDDAVVGCRNWQCLAIALRQLGRYEESLVAHRQAALTANDETSRQNAQNSLGHTLWRVGRYDEAIACFRAMLEWAERHSLIVHEATAHNNLGLVYSDMERLDEARDHHEKALRLRSAFHDAGAICSSYLNLGNIMVQRDDPAGGVALWGRASEISRRLGDAPTEAMIENNLGEVSYNAGDYRAALGHFQNSLEMKEALNLRSYLGSSLEGLAKSHFELRADTVHRALCREFALRLLALDAARPQQRETGREILAALDAGVDKAPRN